MKTNVWSTLLIVCGLLLALTGSVGAQDQDTGVQASLDTAFTYQGRLLKDGNPVNDTCDFRFSLWDAANDGNQVGNTQTISGVGVNDGRFGVSLNGGGEFGSSAFAGEARYLQIAARCTGDGDFVSLSGRVALNAAPYALYASSAPWSGLTGLPAGFADDVDDGDYQNVIVVAKSGGHFTAVQSALNSINDNSASNRYLVWVAPGTYTETVTMKPYVDIEGAGELTTRITAGGSMTYTTSTVVGADNAELRFLTVENTGGNSYAVAVYNNSASPRLTHLTILASGASSNGQNYGVLNHSSSPIMTNVIITSTSGSKYPYGGNYGVYNDASSPRMTNVTAAALGIVTEGAGSTISAVMDISYGVYNCNNSLPTMANVTVTGIGSTGYGVYNNASSPTMVDMTVTQLGIDGHGVYNGNNSSPTMTNLTVSGKGSYIICGVYNSSSSPTMTNMVVTAWGFIEACGVYNDASSPTMTNVTIVVGGIDDGYGVYNDASSPTMTNVTITARGENANSIGIRNSAADGSHTVTINNSHIASDLNTIVNDAEFTTFVGASLLSGGAVDPGGGTVTCAGVYDEDYAFYSSTCP